LVWTQDKIQSFWDITKGELDGCRAELRNKDRAIEDIQNRHHVEIKASKHKSKDRAMALNGLHRLERMLRVKCDMDTKHGIHWHCAMILLQDTHLYLAPLAVPCILHAVLARSAALLRNSHTFHIPASISTYPSITSTDVNTRLDSSGSQYQSWHVQVYNHF
jgi:hypothetical protein